MSLPIVYFDLELGGLELHHPITQLGAVAMQGGVQIGEFETKLWFNPATCDPEALDLNGYSYDAWKNAKRPEDAAREFAKWLEPFKCISKQSKKTGKWYQVTQLAGYNAATFDAPRLQKLFKDCDVFLPTAWSVLDVMQLVMWYFKINRGEQPENIKLATACNFFDVPLDNAHDALSDAIATAQLAQKVGESLVDCILEKFSPKFSNACAEAAQLVELERWRK